MKATLPSAFLVCAIVAFAGCTESDRLTVFAAASFTELATALVDSFAVTHDIESRISVGSSSVLARQIEGGAPADVFLSADTRWVEYLDSLSRVDRKEIPAFTNRLAVFYRPDQATYDTPKDLARMSRIAVGDPDHVPAGRYAKQALTCLGLWEEVRSKLVPTADTRASLHTLQTGATPSAIGYFSDARFVDDAIRVVALPSDCAPDIRYGAATIAGSPRREVADAFLSFVLHDDQRDVWTLLGFQEVNREP